MKKALVFILILAMTICCFVACDMADHNSDEQFPTSPTETNEPKEENEPPSELFCDLSEISVWTDQDGEFYVYVKSWDAYRHLPELSSYHNWRYYFTDNCITVDGETATFSLIDQNRKHDEPTIIIYHFNKNDKNIESYSVKLNIKACSECDTFFVNMLNADHGYYFLTPNAFGEMDDRMDGVHEWPLFMFETTDGGKSWNQISTNTFYITKYIYLIKFISPQVGIISARDEGAEELFDRTYLTVDGGLTWNKISQLPHSEVVKWYSNVIDLEYLEDYGYYRLTVKASNYTIFQVQLWSKDLINWSIIET